MARLVNVTPATVLRHLIAYAKDKGFWPSALDLYRRRKRALGGSSQVRRVLINLAKAGLVTKHGGGNDYRWIPTHDGYAYVHLPPVHLADPPTAAQRRNNTRSKQTKARNKARNDAARLLDLHTPHHPSTAPPTWPHTLPVVE